MKTKEQIKLIRLCLIVSIKFNSYNYGTILIDEEERGGSLTRSTVGVIWQMKKGATSREPVYAGTGNATATSRTYSDSSDCSLVSLEASRLSGIWVHSDPSVGLCCSGSAFVWTEEINYSGPSKRWSHFTPRRPGEIGILIPRGNLAPRVETDPPKCRANFWTTSNAPWNTPHNFHHVTMAFDIVFTDIDILWLGEVNAHHAPMEDQTNLTGISVIYDKLIFRSFNLDVRSYFCR